MLPSDTTELLLRSRLVGDIDVLEDVCLGELVLLALRRLVLIRTRPRPASLNKAKISAVGVK
jgi:hypothetical protein